MKIKEFRINGFRGFKENVIVKLNPDINVFVGINGAGKSSLLDAMAGMLSYVITRLSNDRVFNTYFDDDDVNDESESFSSDILLQFEGEPHELGLFYADKLSKPNPTVSHRVYFKDKVFRKKLTQLRNEAVHFEESVKLPVIIFYHAHRMMKGVKKTRQSKKKMTKADYLYEEAIKQEISSFESFENWYLSEKNFENQMRLKNDNLKFSSIALKVVELAMTKFFNKMGAKENHYSKLDLFYEDDSTSVSRWNTNRDPELCLRKKDKIIKLNKMSDGEKMVLIIVCDIARRLSIANAGSDSQQILNGEGVVLIDEIELHLHPAWQRKIVLALSSVFKNIQFIFSTHSPQVLSGVKQNKTFGIDDYHVHKISSLTKGRDSNSILWDIYAIPERPEEDKAKFSAFYKLLEEDIPNQEKIKELLKELIDSYGTDDSEVLKAKLHFEMEFGVE